eukprot:g7467.t1
MSKIGKLKELKEEQVYFIDRLWGPFMNVFVDTSTLWIFETDMYDTFTLVTRITREQCQQVKLCESPINLTGIRKIRIGTNVASLEYLSTKMPYLNETVLFTEIDFGKKSMQAKTVVIQGECIALNGFGQHMLFWKFERDGQSQLNLYAKDPAQLDALKPITSLDLGNGVMNVSAISLDRRTWTFNDMSNDSPHQLPLICILRAQQSNADVLVWDADSDKVLTRIDVPIKQVKYDSRRWFELSASPDGKWLAILGGCCTIRLFSFFSGVQVWQTVLNGSFYLEDRFMPLSFNALSTTLVVNCDNDVYVFVPPCLIKDYIFDDKCVHCEIDFKNNPDLDEEVFSIVKEDQLQTVSSSVLGLQSLLNLCFQQIEGKHTKHQFIKVANPFFTSKMAIMIHKDTCFSIILASLREICSSDFVHLVENLLQGSKVEHEFREIQIQEGLAKQKFMSFLDIECIVLYPNKRQSNDFIAILGTDGFHTNAIFIDPTANSQELLCFETGMVYDYVQSKDGLKVMCMKENGILIIDLEQKAIEHMVDYQVNFLKWININYQEKKLKIMEIESSSENDDAKEYYPRYLHKRKCRAPPQIANNGKSILLGWSVKDQEPVFITPTTNDQDLNASTIKEKKIVPCWALDDTFQKFSFIVFDKYWQSIISIGTYSSKNSKCKHFHQDDWTSQFKRVLMNIEFVVHETCNMVLCECDGYLNLLVYDPCKHAFNIFVVPMTQPLINPYLPCLHSLDYPSKSIGVEDLDKFVSEFGTSFFNMPFNEKTNLHIAIEHGDVDMIKTLTSSAYRNNMLLGINCSQAIFIESTSNLLDVAIQHNNSEDVMIAVLDIFKKRQIPFIYGANAIEESFQSLWRSNQAVLEELFLDNSLCWEMSTLDVPSYILKNKAYAMNRVGTFDDLLINRKEGNTDIITNIWRSSNNLGVKSIHEKIEDTKVKANVKVICFGNIGKIGSQGILRFLILQQAPTYIFKTPIVKWTVLYKWEHFWKRKSVKRLIQFVVALGAFTLYVVCIGLSRHSLKNNVALQVCTSLILMALVGFIMAMLREEMMQFKTYLTDGKEMFHDNGSRGVKHYLGSIWNLLELLTYAILIFLIVPMYFLSFQYSSLFQCFYVVLAIESILMWFKVWYFLQAFSETGALVLMIENVIKDCIPFLLLSGVVLVGFSTGLFAMFQDVIQAIDSSKQEENDRQEENETHQKIISSFETPQKAMLTLFFAMIGTFDTEVYSESGKLSPIIVLFFVLYLSIQAIVMFNMLIAIMSDTFDKVKSTEEEQLLMGRAQFIDACEAALTENQIKSMNEKIGKYLYILFSKDEDINKESSMWNGRINNIKDNVKKHLWESQTTILEEIKNMRKDNESLEKRIKDESAQALVSLEGSMKAEMMAMKEQIKADIASVLEHLKTIETH